MPADQHRAVKHVMLAQSMPLKPGDGRVLQLELAELLRDHQGGVWFDKLLDRQRLMLATESVSAIDGNRAR